MPKRRRNRRSASETVFAAFCRNGNRRLASGTLGVKLETSEFILAATGLESILGRTGWAFSTVEVHLVYTKTGLGGLNLLHWDRNGQKPLKPSPSCILDGRTGTQAPSIFFTGQEEVRRKLEASCAAILWRQRSRFGRFVLLICKPKTFYRNRTGWNQWH